MSASWLWRRLVSLGVVLLLVSLVTYLLIDFLPGDPAIAVLGQSATPESIADRAPGPLARRPAAGALRRLARAGAAGRSRRVVPHRRGDHGGLRQRLGTSLELLALTQLAAILLSVPAALLAARRERAVLDRVLSNGAFVAVAMPQFAFGIALLVVFAQKLEWFPVAHYVRSARTSFDNLHALVLPVLTLAVPLAGIYYRVLRTDLMQTLRSDHITFARAMGLSPRRVLLGRALRPSSLTLVSVIGLNTAFLLGGAAIVERLFSACPGLGAFMTEGVLTQDVVKVQGAALRDRVRLRGRQPGCRSVAHAVRSPCPAGPEGGVKLAGPRQLQTRYGTGGVLALGVVGAADVLRLLRSVAAVPATTGPRQHPPGPRLAAPARHRQPGRRHDRPADRRLPDLTGDRRRRRR